MIILAVEQIFLMVLVSDTSLDENLDVASLHNMFNNIAIEPIFSFHEE